MRVMVIVKFNEDTEASVMADEQLLTEMGKCSSGWIQGNRDRDLPRGWPLYVETSPGTCSQPKPGRYRHAGMIFRKQHRIEIITKTAG